MVVPNDKAPFYAAFLEGDAGNGLGGLFCFVFSHSVSSIDTTQAWRVQFFDAYKKCVLEHREWKSTCRASLGFG